MAEKQYKRFENEEWQYFEQENIKDNDLAVLVMAGCMIAVILLLIFILNN